MHDDSMKKVRRKTETKEMKELTCFECGYVLQRDMKECPSCGKIMKRSMPLVTFVPGDMEHVEEIDGSAGSFNGDWWPEICAYASCKHPANKKNAKRLAHGIWYGLHKKASKVKWRRFTFDLRDPNPVVYKHLENRRKRYWLIQKKKKERERSRVTA